MKFLGEPPLILQVLAIECRKVLRTQRLSTFHSERKCLFPYSKKLKKKPEPS